MATTYDLVTGDTASVLRITCKDRQSKAAINLTGATVHLQWINKSGALVQRVMTIESTANGITSYRFTSGEIEASSMKCEVQITDLNGRILTVLDPIILNVRREIG